MSSLLYPQQIVSLLNESNTPDSENIKKIEELDTDLKKVEKTLTEHMKKINSRDRLITNEVGDKFVNKPFR